MSVTKPIVVPRIGDSREIFQWRNDVADRLEFSLENNITTTDAVGQTLLGVIVPPLTVLGVEAWLFGVVVETTNPEPIGATAAYLWYGGAKLDASGAAAFIGSGAMLQNEISYVLPFPKSWLTLLAVSGNKVVMNVQGQAGDTVQWKCRMRVFQVSV